MPLSYECVYTVTDNLWKGTYCYRRREKPQISALRGTECQSQSGSVFFHKIFVQFSVNIIYKDILSLQFILRRTNALLSNHLPPKVRVFRLNNQLVLIDGGLRKNKIWNLFSNLGCMRGHGSTVIGHNDIYQSVISNLSVNHLAMQTLVLRV